MLTIAYVVFNISHLNGFGLAVDSRLLYVGCKSKREWIRISTCLHCEGGKPHSERFEILIKPLLSFWMMSSFLLPHVLRWISHYSSAHLFHEWKYKTRPEWHHNYSNVIIISTFLISQTCCGVTRSHWYAGILLNIIYQLKVYFEFKHKRRNL